LLRSRTDDDDDEGEPVGVKPEHWPRSKRNGRE
jgi:hypothetical protein